MNWSIQDERLRLKTRGVKVEHRVGDGPEAPVGDSSGGVKDGAELRLFSTNDNRDYEARFVDCTGPVIASRVLDL